MSPFKKEHINPASYDVTLSPFLLKVIPQDVIDPFDLENTLQVEMLSIPPLGLVLQPGFGYLGSTNEVIGDPEVKYAMHLHGKSTLGRCFLSVHATAGFGDPGFQGQITLEMTCVYPIRVYADMQIGQIEFDPTEGEPLSYASTGRYMGQNGPTIPKSLKHPWRKEV